VCGLVDSRFPEVVKINCGLSLESEVQTQFYKFDVTVPKSILELDLPN